jgi:hypothetical protein
MDERYAINLLRLIGAQIAVQNSLALSREMFGKSSFALGQVEKVSVDQAIFGLTQANYQTITPEFLAEQQTRQPIGFPIQPSSPTPGSIPQT